MDYAICGIHRTQNFGVTQIQFNPEQKTRLTEIPSCIMDICHNCSWSEILRSIHELWGYIFGPEVVKEVVLEKEFSCDIDSFLDH